MIITKVKIENFKSIESIEIPFDKNGNSYTKILVGINESGKSNILEALSYFEIPEDEVSFGHFCNQKLEESDSCDITFSLSIEKEEEKSLIESINKKIQSDFDIEFSISNIEKIVYLEKGKSSFESYYTYDVSVQNTGLFIMQSNELISIVEEANATVDYVPLNSESFKDNFYDIISDYFVMQEPPVSIWKPSTKYLLYDANLNDFKEKPGSNKPLYNIFRLSGYTDRSSIKEAIEGISDSRKLSKLKSKLSENINNYVGKVWNHNIVLIIEINDTGKFSLLIRDKGEENKHDRFSITDRSQGAQQFLSIIFSLSLETENRERKNELILIDEPEVHLHPSGIRDLAKELLKIGRNNYVFLATHSPFMIDKAHKERHFIVKKDNKAITKLKRIRESDNIIDDEVLREAFGMDVYKDLLNPQRLLVEGASDKVILQKAFACLGYDKIGITNGHGNNIITLVSKLNYDDICILVVLDDDEDGRKDKKTILKVGGNYTEASVFTIRDLVGEVVNRGTIEDLLDIGFVKAQFEKCYKDTYGDDPKLEFDPARPIIEQIAIELKRKKLFSKWDMDLFKKQLSDNFSPTKSSLSAKNMLLKKLAEKIMEKLNNR